LKVILEGEYVKALSGAWFEAGTAKEVCRSRMIKAARQQLPISLAARVFIIELFQRFRFSRKI
jgi:hypothetical protein